MCNKETESINSHIQTLLYRFAELCESDLLADFLVVYIQEAHPSEGGHFDGNIPIADHKSMQDRIAAAETMVEEAEIAKFPCPIVIDKMDNAANHAYGALPERLFIVMDGRVLYVGGEGPQDYVLTEAEDKLRDILESSPKKIK